MKAKKTDLTFEQAKAQGGLFNSINKSSHQWDFVLFSSGGPPLYYNMLCLAPHKMMRNADIPYFHKGRFRPTDKKLYIEIK